MPQQACRLYTSRLELAVTLHSVLNLDLCSQGWYAVRVAAHPTGEYGQVRVTECIQSADTTKNLIQAQQHLDSTVDGNSMRSRVFLIRYIQQKVALGHTICFAVDQATQQEAVPVSCRLEIELLYQPLTHCRSVDPPRDLRLTVLDKQNFLLFSCEQGLHALQPATFAVPNLALCNISVHTCTLQQSAEHITVRPSDDFEGDVECQPSQYIRSALSQCWGTPQGRPLPHFSRPTKPAASPSSDLTSVSGIHGHSRCDESEARLHEVGEQLHGTDSSLSNSTVIDLPQQAPSRCAQHMQQYEAADSSQHASSPSSPKDVGPSSQYIIDSSGQQHGMQCQQESGLSMQQLTSQIAHQETKLQCPPQSHRAVHQHTSNEQHLMHSSIGNSQQEHAQQDMRLRQQSASHAHQGGFASLQEEHDFEGLSVCSGDCTEPEALLTCCLTDGQPQASHQVFERVRAATSARLSGAGLTQPLTTGAMRSSAAALGTLLQRFNGSKHYAHMQRIRNRLLVSCNLASTLAPAAHDSHAASPQDHAAHTSQPSQPTPTAAVEPTPASHTDTQHSSCDQSGSQHSPAAAPHNHQHFAAAYAADWACLMWLLQTAPDEILGILRVQWQEHQAEEFALWVRPASELSAVRSKAAAKVMRQQLRELSVTSCRSSITHAMIKSSPSTAVSPTAAGLHRLQLSQGGVDAASGQQSPLQVAGNMVAGGSPAVQLSSPSKLWGGSTPPLHPSSPKGGLAALRKLRWGKASGQGSKLVALASSHSGHGRRADATGSTSLSNAHGQVVQFSEPSRSWDHGQDVPSVPQSRSPSRLWNVLSPGVQSSSGSRTGGGMTPLVQSTSPSRNWGTGTPLAHPNSPGVHWGTGTPLIQSTSPSKNWGTGTPLVQSSSPSRAWGIGAGTPPVQSSAPSFLRGWLSKQRGRSVIEEQAMQAFRLQLALGDGHAMPAVPTIQDQRLHDKPHHQPILFINDSLAPDLQPVLLHATLPPGTQDGVSTNPHKQTPKPSALRSALNAVSKSFSAYHKGSKQSALQHEGASDMISSQPAMHHSYSMGQPDWLVQSRHASLDFTASGAYSGGEGVQLLGGAEGNLAVKVPLRPTSSCPAMSPVGHTRSSLMHSLSRSGMNYSPKQLATSRRRGTLAPRAGISADYDATDGHMTPAPGSTPTAAEVSMLQAAAFQAVLDKQQARRHVPPTQAAHTSAAVAPMPTAVAAAPADAGWPLEQDFAANAAMSPVASTSAAVAQRYQAASATASNNLDSMPVGMLMLDDLDAIDLEIAPDAASGSTALLLPCLGVNSAEPALPSSTTPLIQDPEVNASSAVEHHQTPAGSPQLAYARVPDGFSETGSLLQLAAQDDPVLATDATLLQHDYVTSSSNNAAAETSTASAQHTDRQPHPLDHSVPGVSDMQVGFTLAQRVTPTWRGAPKQPSWYQHGSLASSTAASDSSHDTLHDMHDIRPSAASTSSATAALPPEQYASSSLHSLGHFHLQPLRMTDVGTSPVTAGPAPIEQPSDNPVAAQDSEADSNAAKEKQPTVSRVMSKLHSLQSMTHRLRTQSQRVLQPVACQAAPQPDLSCISEADHQSATAVKAASLHPAEAHVVVFVHGFRGSARDLGAVRSHMQLAQPELDFLMSKANQERTSDGFQVMGQRLALEVSQYLQEHDSGKHRQLGKLSFVGHSLGNIIIRAALTEPCLKPYLGRMWLFVSLSGPHLGYLCAPNKLFCSGMWLFKKFTAGRTLHELTFTDAPQLEDCYLYKLAALPSLIHFKCVLLTASPQDQYVPFDSTRVQSPHKQHSGPHAIAQKDMAKQILSNLGRPGGTQLIRVDVDFPVKQWKSVNNAVGRTAHLAFVESEVFIRFLVWSILHAKALI